MRYSSSLRHICHMLLIYSFSEVEKPYSTLYVNSIALWGNKKSNVCSMKSCGMA